MKRIGMSRKIRSGIRISISLPHARPKKRLAAGNNNRIIPISMKVARIWGDIQGNAEKHGKKIPVVASLIAATAIAHDLNGITRNTADMEKPGVPIHNPWESM
ncbi:MAG: hypothetical protein ACLFUL_14100 [Desulfobacteraceae bacterium]